MVIAETAIKLNVMLVITNSSAMSISVYMIKIDVAISPTCK